jgi:hypothetical protein
MSHRQWHLDAVRKRTRDRRAPQKPDWKIATEDADDAYIDGFNRRMAKQAHLLILSGSKADWLLEWMKEPFKAPKQAVTVLDTELNLSISGEKPKLTRKREWVVGHE